MDNAFYDRSCKMSELVTAHATLVMILRRMGIAMGFGNKSIDEVCRQYGVDTNFFLLISHIYTHDGYVPSREQILSTDMSQLVDYLRASHRYYVETRLPHIKSHLGAIASQLPERMATVFMRFFDDYMREVCEHFDHEEQNVYPHVEALQRGERDTRYSIDTFIDSHGNLEDKLADLLQIIFKYLPENLVGADLVDVVYDILQVSHDLNKHSLIEEKILVPYVKHLELTTR